MSLLSRVLQHKLAVEDEYLLVLMRLRMGLTIIDLGERFGISESTVNNIFLTWINYLYVTLGSLKISRNMATQGYYFAKRTCGILGKVSEKHLHY